jgi:hypothetical protein
MQCRRLTLLVVSVSDNNPAARARPAREGSEKGIRPNKIKLSLANTSYQQQASALPRLSGLYGVDSKSTGQNARHSLS